MTRILVTENGQHSADLWGLTTAEAVLPLDDTTLVGSRLLLARSLQDKIAHALSDTVSDLQVKENEALASDPEHVATPLNPMQWVNTAIGYIQDVAKDSPWAQHFLEEAVVAVLRQIIGGHFATVQHVARLCHTDQHPDDEHCRKYRAIYAQ